MPERIGVTVQNKQADSLGGTFYGGGTLAIYTGAQPATADTAVTGTLLVTITLPATPFAAASAGSAAKSGTWAGVAVATGDAGYFRMLTSGATHPIDGAITVSGGSGELELATLAIVSAQTVTISAFAINQPAQ